MEYLFGLGDGWLGKRAAKIAEKHGAELVNHQDPQCRCGHGCPPHECHAARRHWFAGPNQGEPFNSRLARDVMAELANTAHPHPAAAPK